MDRLMVDLMRAHVVLCPEQIGTKPAFPSQAICDLRARLIDEEAKELIDAIKAGDLAKVADNIVDLIYVSVGTGVAFGIDLDPVWDAVCRANLAKAGGGRREDGKWVKPAGWQEPPVAAILADQCDTLDEMY